MLDFNPWFCHKSKDVPRAVGKMEISTDLLRECISFVSQPRSCVFVLNSENVPTVPPRGVKTGAAATPEEFEAISEVRRWFCVPGLQRDRCRPDWVRPLPGMCHQASQAPCPSLHSVAE